MFIQGAQSLSVFVCLFLSTSKHPHDEAIIVTVHCLYQDQDCSAAKDQSVFTIAEKAPIWAFSWLKAATTAFTFKTLYAKQALTPW